jgi:plastocyanin
MPRLLALAVLCSLLLVAPARAARHTVGISVFEFRSARLVVKAGDTVRWRWDGPDTGHSVTALTKRAHAFDSDPGLSAGALDHPVGFVFTHTFSRPGTYRYFCRVHPSMRGVVVVRSRVARRALAGARPGDTNFRIREAPPPG